MRKTPRLLARASERLHPDLEEVDLGELTGRVDERHGHLALGVAERRNEATHRPRADVVAVVAVQLPEPRRSEPLSASRERAARGPDRRRRFGHLLGVPAPARGCDGGLGTGTTLART